MTGEAGRRSPRGSGHRVRLIGDDLFTTNVAGLAGGIARGAANGVLVKVNQNGTLTGTLDVVAARQGGGLRSRSFRRAPARPRMTSWPISLSAPAPGRSRSAPCGYSERLAKYNQLVRIAEDESLPFAPSPARLRADGWPGDTRRAGRQAR